MLCLIVSAVLESGYLWLRLVLNQECLDPVVVLPLADAIGDRGTSAGTRKRMPKALLNPSSTGAGRPRMVAGPD